MTTQPTRVLFLCTGNSCRSQMAEGFARDMHGDWLDPYSAGVEKHGLNPMAVAVMEEIGVDVSSQTSKTLDELPRSDFDIVITVCGNAHDRCPHYGGGTRVLHVAFDDPARASGSRSEILAEFRWVRDAIKAFMADFEGFVERS